MPVLKLSETEQRILSELEEAGGEDVPTIMVTIMQPHGNASELDQVRVALTNLLQADLVRMCIDRDENNRLRRMTRQESLTVVADLGNRIVFVESDRAWGDNRNLSPPFGESFPFVLITEAGKKMAFSILDQRGYQWWRQKR